MILEGFSSLNDPVVLSFLGTPVWKGRLECAPSLGLQSWALLPPAWPGPSAAHGMGLEAEGLLLLVVCVHRIIYIFDYLTGIFAFFII